VFSGYLARQLSIPSGIVGRLVLAPLWNRRNSALNDAALESLALDPRDRVLEVGFGGGYLLGRMAAVVTEGLVAGVDVSQAMLEYCERRYRPLIEEGRLELSCAGAEALPHPSGRFTKAVTVNSLFYWDDVPQALAELCRVLEKGCRLVLCLTCKGSLEKRDFARQGLALYEDEELCRAVQAAGFGQLELSRAADRHREFVCLVGIK